MFGNCFQLLNWYKIVTYIIMLIFFLKTANLIINNWLLLSRHKCRAARPSSPFDKIWRQGDKNLNFQWIGENLEVQSRLFKNPNFPSLLWIGDQILNLDELGKVKSYSRLSLTSLLKIGWRIHKEKDDHILNLTYMNEIFHSLKF